MSIYQLGGRVPVRARVNVWPYVTIRGDSEPIEIAENRNVQECCALHTDPGFPVTVAANVTEALRRLA